jgi:hypothetical protein
MEQRTGSLIVIPQERSQWRLGQGEAQRVEVTEEEEERIVIFRSTTDPKTGKLTN